MTLDILNRVKRARSDMEGLALIAPYAAYVRAIVNDVPFMVPTDGDPGTGGLYQWRIDAEGVARYAGDVPRRTMLRYYEAHRVVPIIVVDAYAFAWSRQQLPLPYYPLSNMLAIRTTDFGTYNAAFTGNTLVPLLRRNILDMRMLDQFNQALAQRKAEPQIKGSTPELRAAYTFLYTETEPDLTQRIHMALGTAATLVRYKELGNGNLQVTFKAQSGNYTVTVQEDTLNVITHGLCLYTADYSELNLASFPRIVDYGRLNHIGHW